MSANNTTTSSKTTKPMKCLTMVPLPAGRGVPRPPWGQRITQHLHMQNKSTPLSYKLTGEKKS